MMLQDTFFQGHRSHVGSRGSTGAGKYPFEEIDFQAIFICINILNANEI